MPEQISTGDFVKEVWGDINSPTTSSFVPKMGKCKNSVSATEETLDSDRSGLTKMKKSAKALYSSGSMHVSNEAYLAENLEKLGNNALNRDHEVDIGAAFLKFAVVTKELSALMKNLMQNLSNILMFPLDSFLKGDLKVKGDLKKPFDKACKEYDSKFNKIEKEKKQLAEKAGMLRTEVQGTEVAEEMEKERRMFQLQMCEYLIKVNEIKTKKGVDLLQHLVEYYQAQTNYFQDGLKTIEHFRCYIEDLVKQLNVHKQAQDAERRTLIELRDQLKASMSVYKENSSVSSGYSLHQLQGNKVHGYEKQGVLLKKSEGVRKVWGKRRCQIKDGYLSISHQDVSKEPVKLNLLTCQVKLVHDDPAKKYFDLISSSKNRTYHFQAEDTRDMEEWISVLNNAKEAVLLKAFGESAGPDSSPLNQSVKELTRTIIGEIKRLPGNKQCCDCNAPDPEWLSVNLGVLVCLECCGMHRDMGVHISRMQSIVIDHLGTSQLLLARVVSNRGFNDIMEATLDPSHKPHPTSEVTEKKAFIRSKYEKHRYAIVTCTNPEDRRQDLKQAVLSRDVFALLQVYAEGGIGLMENLPDMENDETALHLAIDQEEDGSTLHIVDFILQNSNNHDLGKTTKDGDTVLHLCARSNKTEVMKLLLRVRPELCEIENGDGESALDIARSMNYDLCVELLMHAVSGKTELFENVNIDWNLISDERLYEYDCSDDDLDAGTQTPDRKTSRSRPSSIALGCESTMPLPGKGHSREHSLPGRDHWFPSHSRDHSTEGLKPTGGVPPPPPKPGKMTVKQLSYDGSGQYSVPPSVHHSFHSSTLPHNMTAASMTQSAHFIHSTSTLPHNKTKGGIALTSGTSTLPTKKKAPAPPPPGVESGHTRNPSDPLPPTHPHRHLGFNAPLPPGVQMGHTRNPSDPLPPPGGVTSGVTVTTGGRKRPGHVRSPSDPPPLPVKPAGLRVAPAGGKFVLPPPPDLKPGDLRKIDSKPVPAPRPRKSTITTDSNEALSKSLENNNPTSRTWGDNNNQSQPVIHSLSQSHHGSQLLSQPQPVTHSVNGRSRSTDSQSRSSMDSLDSVESTGSHKSSGGGPVATPRGKRKFSATGKVRRCKALFDCVADNEDELTFTEGDIIVVLNEEEEEWWEGYIEGNPGKRGMFPTTFVHMLSESKA